MSELTAEELALLQQAEEPAIEEPKRRGRPRKTEAEPAIVEAPEPEPMQAPARGPHTPVQFHDDGWGNWPV